MPRETLVEVVRFNLPRRVCDGVEKQPCVLRLAGVAVKGKVHRPCERRAMIEQRRGIARDAKRGCVEVLVGTHHKRPTLHQRRADPVCPASRLAPVHSLSQPALAQLGRIALCPAPDKGNALRVTHKQTHPRAADAITQPLQRRSGIEQQRLHRLGKRTHFRAGEAFELGKPLRV